VVIATATSCLTAQKKRRLRFIVIVEEFKKINNYCGHYSVQLQTGWAINWWALPRRRFMRWSTTFPASLDPKSHSVPSE